MASLKQAAAYMTRRSTWQAALGTMVFLLSAGCSDAAEPNQTAIVKKAMTQITPLHKKMGPP
ncbi:MAG: hypothetical protein N2C14_29480, partial [Planctomycetales bacterium]